MIVTASENDCHRLAEIRENAVLAMHDLLAAEDLMFYKSRPGTYLAYRFMSVKRKWEDNGFCRCRRG